MSPDTRQDNFGINIANPMTNLLKIPGHHDYTPERIRVYRNGARIYLQYGDDSHYSETDVGRTLLPDAGDVMTLNTAKRVSYPVGFDIVPSMAWEVKQPPEEGDVMAGGFGEPDVTNFDPVAEEYTGGNADGDFWYITGNTGLDEALFAKVRNGTILDSQRSTLRTPADVWGRYAQWQNWYDVGPARFIETYTDGDQSNSDFPQVNDNISSLSNDNGKGTREGSKRYGVQIYRDTNNSAFELEVGSFGVAIPGRFDYNFKDKGHSQKFDVTNTTEDEYQVVEAIRSDPDRPLVETNLLDITVLSKPSSDAEIDVQARAVDPDSTNLGDADFETPKEHSRKNSVIEVATDNTATGPETTDAGTDSTGAARANILTNLGGYYIHRVKEGSSGTGAKTSSSTSDNDNTRTIHDIDIALIVIDASVSGTYEIDFITGQNN